LGTQLQLQLQEQETAVQQITPAANKAESTDVTLKTLSPTYMQTVTIEEGDTTTIDMVPRAEVRTVQQELEEGAHEEIKKLQDELKKLREPFTAKTRLEVMKKRKSL
jgi:CRISPR/Cas system endoribonuclease Cas6 (RAMP superfamily)